MRVAVVCDLHGNLPAVEAVTREIERAGVELLVVGGDVVPGPMPRNTLELLLGLDIPVRFIKGNGEADALAAMAGTDAARVPEQYRDIVRWSARQLYPEYEELVASWPKTLRVRVEPFGEVLFCHATPRDDNEIFTRLTPEECLLAIFKEPGVSLVICGHTHMQFDRMIGSVRVVNTGSLGMPFGEPGAYWLLLDGDVQLRHTNYDIGKAAERIRKTDYPQANEFAENYVLNPPQEQEMLEIFTRGGLR